MSLLDELYFYKAFGYKFVPKFTDNSLTFTDNLHNLNKQISSCNLCNLCKTRNKAVLGSGKQEAKIVLISHEASINDDKIGQASIPQILLDIFFDLNIALDDIYYTHEIKCCPQKSRAKDDFFSWCSDYLKNELRLINPNLVVIFGEQAFKNIFGEIKYSHQSLRGGVFLYNNLNFLLTYSVEKISKNPSYFSTFLNDLSKIKDYL